MGNGAGQAGVGSGAGEGPPTGEALPGEVRTIWNTLAPFWDEVFGEGNVFHRELIAPATERLLDIKPGEAVVDIACGNGAFSRRQAMLGARVVACDVSEVFIERAGARTAGHAHADRITYRVVDAAREAELLALGEGAFDAAVCTMALMDMAEIDPLLRTLPRLLKPGGRFVFSVLHPCFNTQRTTKVVTEEDRAGELVITHGVLVTRYLGLQPERGVGIPGQPVPHYYFQRPLGVLFGACFRAGWVLDGLEEPAFDGAVDNADLINWRRYREIPPALVARLRPASAS